MQFSGINILFIIIFFNFLFIAAVTFIIKKGKPYSNKLFALFLLSKLLCFSTDFFFYNFNYSIKHFINLFFIGTSFDLLLGPLLFFYILSLIRKELKFHWKHALHLAPFILHLSYMYIIFHSKSIEIKKDLITTNSIFSIDFVIINEGVIYLFFIIYSALVIRELLQYQKKLQNIYFNFNKLEMNWMIVFVSILGFNWFFGICSTASDFIGINFMVPLYVFIISIFLTSNIIFFYGLYYSNIFLGIDKAVIKKKYEKTFIADDKKECLLNKLITHIENNKPYLEPNININKLSEEISIPSYQISQVLNSKLNKNFYEVISYYRIKESIKELSKTDNNDKTILEILYDVGFNSKSAFNKAFKKHTGITPTEYKKHSSKITISSNLEN